MPKAHFAEWLLARASTPERASEIVGDLTEQRLSALSFWLTTTGILVALTWRWMLGFVLAGACAVAEYLPTRSRTDKKRTLQNCRQLVNLLGSKFAKYPCMRNALFQGWLLLRLSLIESPATWK